MNLGLILALLLVFSGCSISNQEVALDPGVIFSYIDDGGELFDHLNFYGRVISMLQGEASEDVDDVFQLARFYFASFQTAVEMGDEEWADINYVKTVEMILELRSLLEDEGMTLPEIPRIRGQEV